MVNGRDMFGFILKKLQAACDVANLESWIQNANILFIFGKMEEVNFELKIK